MPEAVRQAEEVPRVAPLAARFRDDFLGLRVGDGLEVSARAADGGALRCLATASPSGTFVFHRLPGLVSLPDPPARPRRPVLFGAGDEAYWRDLPGTRRYVVEVRDAWDRFLPISFAAEAPARGPFLPGCLSGGSPPGSPPEPDDAIPLFSTARRSLAGPVAVVRAELWDPARDAPAAWALVEGRAAGGRWFRGMADAGGRLALFLAYPEPPDPFGDPPSSWTPGMGPALTDQAWDLELRAFYGGGPPAPEPVDLCEVLAQPPAPLWASYAGRRAFVCPPLSYGQELVLRSEDAGPGAGAVRVGP